MNITNTNQSFNKKMPSMLITGALHIAALTLALQASNVINIKPPGVIIFDKFDFEKIEEPPTPTVSAPKTVEPNPIFVPMPEVPIIPSVEPPPITSTTTLNPGPKNFETHTNEGTDTSTEVKTHTPVHIAAQVVSSACDKPEYPTSSVRNGEEGTVNIAMLIGIDGTVIESRVEKSSGSRALDKAAIQGLSLCKFKPGSTDGVAEKSWAKLQYVWTLNN